jgi:hypothetical protein
MRKSAIDRRFDGAASQRIVIVYVVSKRVFMNLSDSTDIQGTTGAGRAKTAIQQAAAQCAMLRRAFHLCASRGSKADEWKLLEESAAATLARHFENRLDGKELWFEELSRALRTRMGVLLARMSPQSDRYRQYLRAAESLHANGDRLKSTLPGGEIGYWVCEALVWTALWHAADAQNITPAQARQWLDDAFSVTPSQAVKPDPGPRAWLAARGWLRGASSRKRA